MTMERPSFIYQCPASRVLFGPGCLASLADELSALAVQRVLVLCTPEQRATADHVASLLGSRAVSVFDRARMHVPIAIAREAAQVAAACGADGMVAVGGGSTIGLGKAVALESRLPVIAIPTTFAGSEMTSIYGITEAGVKKTGRDARVLPRTVLYDPTLLRSLPAALCVTSGFNAMAHGIEALYAHDGNPVVSLMAQEGVRAMAAAVALLQREPASEAARAQGLYGAWLCGSVLSAVAMGLHHKLCHTLGGSFDLPHAETHAVMLPHIVAYNAGSAPQAMARVAQALNVDAQQVPLALHQRVSASGAPVSLKQIGMPPSGLDRAADVAVQSPYPNPRPLERAAIRALLQRAYDGSAPGLDS